MIDEIHLNHDPIELAEAGAGRQIASLPDTLKRALVDPN